MDFSTALAVSEIFIIDPFLRPEVETLEKSWISKLLVSLDANVVVIFDVPKSILQIIL